MKWLPFRVPAEKESNMLGQRLQWLRASAGLSQAELARKVGVSAETLEDWEVDEDEPGSGALARLAAELGVPVEELDEAAREGLALSSPR